MRFKWFSMLAGSVLALSLFVGCEWENTDDNDTWDSSYGWVNFSGVYRAADLGLLIRTGFETIQKTGFEVIGTGEGQQPASSTIGTGNNVQRTFAGILQSPIIPGSVTVSDGFESFTDASAGEGGATTGNLVGDQGGTGTVNYQTGAVSVTFNTAPAGGVPIRATYVVGTRRSFSGILEPNLVPGSVTVSDGFESLIDDGAGNLVGDLGGSGTVNYFTGAVSAVFATEPRAGAKVWATYLYEIFPPDVITSDGDTIQASTLPVYSFTVQQVGDYLKFTDNNGNVYEGRVVLLETSGGGTGLTSGTAVGQFEVAGNSGGLPVTIVGTFEGTYVQPAEGNTNGQMLNRTMAGTWVESGGMSGTISAVAPNTTAIVITTTNTDA